MRTYIYVKTYGFYVRTFRSAQRPPLTILPSRGGIDPRRLNHCAHRSTHPTTPRLLVPEFSASPRPYSSLIYLLSHPADKALPSPHPLWRHLPLKTSHCARRPYQDKAVTPCLSLPAHHNPFSLQPPLGLPVWALWGPH